MLGLTSLHFRDGDHDLFDHKPGLVVYLTAGRSEP
jgi:hypothetical protein